MAFSRTEVQKLIETTERAKTSAARLKEKATETMGIALGAMEVSGASFGFGYARGRFATADGEFAVMGVPPDLLAGVALHGLGFLGAFGKKYSEHAHNLANGALASFLSTKGVQFGIEGRKEPLRRPVVGGAGAASRLSSGARLSDAELAQEIARTQA